MLSFPADISAYSPMAAAKVFWDPLSFQGSYPCDPCSHLLYGKEIHQTTVACSLDLGMPSTVPRHAYPLKSRTVCIVLLGFQGPLDGICTLSRKNWIPGLRSLFRLVHRPPGGIYPSWRVSGLVAEVSFSLLYLVACNNFFTLQTNAKCAVRPVCYPNVVQLTSFASLSLQFRSSLPRRDVLRFPQLGIMHGCNSHTSAETLRWDVSWNWPVLIRLEQFFVRGYVQSGTTVPFLASMCRLWPRTRQERTLSSGP